MNNRTDSLQSAVRSALLENRPFSIFHYPGKESITAMVQIDDQTHFWTGEASHGFVFAPYDGEERRVWLPANRCESYVAPLTDMDLSRDGVLFEGEPDSISDSGAHKERVEKAIGFIRSGKASKIVVSRLEVIKGRVYDTLALFFDICRNYPFAFAYLFSHPVSGTWMGATPETLLNLSNGVFQTMALAATRPYRGSLDIAWNSKELEEQRLVETFIQEQLDPITDHLEIDDSRSSRAGNLVHIQTPIRGRLNAAHSISDLIRVLHPTPAVCGTPRPAAAVYIKENENYDRAYYTGYLGEVNGPGQAVLFVNLRCMRVMDDRVYLYVGGGITGESEPGQEWEETVQKSMTMKRLLFRKA